MLFGDFIGRIWDMLVLAALPKHLHSRLKAGITSSYRVVSADGWQHAIDQVLSKPVEMAILDPQLEGEPRVHEIERFRVMFPSLPIILYTSLEPAVAPVLLRLGQANIKRVILAWHDDHPSKIRDVLHDESARSVSQKLLYELRDVLDGFPQKLRWVLEAVIREPAEVSSVQELADLAQMDRRTCLRWFERVDLPKPSVLLTVLRVTYAHRLLQDPGYTVEDVALKLGYGGTKSFAFNVKEIFGMTPGELRVSLTPEEALDIVRRRYFAASQHARAAS